MSSQKFKELPNSTNAVESYNRSDHCQPLKVEMMATYREDMAKAFEIMARERGLRTTYEDEKQKVVTRVLTANFSAKRKRVRLQFTDDVDSPPPPDKRSNFISAHTHTCTCTYSFQYTCTFLAIN